MSKVKFCNVVYVYTTCVAEELQNEIEVLGCEDLNCFTMYGDQLIRYKGKIYARECDGTIWNLEVYKEYIMNDKKIALKIEDMRRTEIDLHELEKYRKMNIFKKLIFRIKARFCKPKLDWDKIILSDSTTILKNLPREDKSHNEIIRR